MHPVERYVRAVSTHDAERVAELFTENGYFEDEPARFVNGEPAKLHGKPEIRDFFEKLFSGHTVECRTVVTFGPRGFYDITIDGKVIPCRALTEERDGRIQSFLIDPR